MGEDYKISYSPKKPELVNPLAILETFRIPNIRYVSPTLLKDIDLIHTPGQLLINKIPWVVEVDNVVGMSYYRIKILNSTSGRWLMKKFLRSGYCKGILCISEAARKSVENTLRDQSINKKIEVIYPYVKPNPNKKIDSDKIRLLFISTNFYQKGGKELLRVFDQLCKKYKNLELTIITKIAHIDSGLLRRYSKNRKIHFLEARYTKEELYREFYPKADIFVVPTYQDSFGLVFLEAISSGLPVISTNMFALNEMVLEGKNGFLIDSPIKYFNEDYTPNNYWWQTDTTKAAKEGNYPSVVKQLSEKLDRLISDKRLRQSMSKVSRELVESGRFSERVRKGRIYKAYKHCLDQS
ncbi:MAG: glycosyltransferase family 4 protein [Candidatus Aenigmarchaeota archaeon]|nr:glycosyltransferase family 4 protein [Candidatus Aenigmarchaeota archaeon]